MNRAVSSADAELVAAIDPKDAFRFATGMEDPLRRIRNFAGALCRIAGTLEDDDGMIVYELASTIRARVEELDDIHGYFFRLHHPDRARFEREGWPSEQAEADHGRT
jgi:hypothetical protein